MFSMLNKEKTYQRNSTRQIGKNNYYSLLILLLIIIFVICIVMNCYMKT